MADLDPFAGLAGVLGVAPVQVDAHRQARKGVPEVVWYERTEHLPAHT